MSQLHQFCRRYVGTATLVLSSLFAFGNTAFAVDGKNKNASNDVEAAATALQQTGFQGAILAARGDKILYKASIGNFGDISRTFRFASITKEMTAIMLMQEVEAGHLQLDATLGTYWPDYPNPAVRAVTIRQLMTHYSGLFNDNAVPTFHMLNANNGDNMQKFATGMCAGQMNSQPGTTFDYNNCDYMVLGALLEKITQQPYAQLLQQRIFAPASMNNSGFYTASMPDNPEHVHGSLGGQAEPEVNFASYGAAGSSFGTLKDLLAFDRAFIKGKYLSTKSRAEMIKPNAVGGALGVWVYPFHGADEKNPTVIVERQGWIAGIRILNLVDVQSGHILIIVSTNGDLDLTQTWANKGPAAGLLKALLQSK